jgi:hypothetical protein
VKLGVGQGRHGHAVSSWTQLSHLACSGMASIDDHGQGREMAWSNGWCVPRAKAWDVMGDKT